MLVIQDFWRTESIHVNLFWINTWQTTLAQKEKYLSSDIELGLSVAYLSREPVIT